MILFILYCLDIYFVVRRKIEEVTKLYLQLPTNILFHLWKLRGESVFP